MMTLSLSALAQKRNQLNLSANILFYMTKNPSEIDAILSKAITIIILSQPLVQLLTKKHWIYFRQLDFGFKERGHPLKGFVYCTFYQHVRIRQK